ncbi:MAG TPA: hypothetical protein VL547_18300, partial [Dinghuibacter sp.]|uniref:hypothetical protein n=1 Tax=Dinghuibacter sp. TaxID=2024697 RepID=UPI002C87954D
MKAIAIVVLACLLQSCVSKKTVPATSPEKMLTDYFYTYEIQPSVVVNNTEGNQTSIQIPPHLIKWFNTDDETKVMIDGDLFTLKDKVTLNKPWDTGNDSVDFVNNWDQ